MKQNHIFSILAYKNSPHLQECIDSLKNQTIQSEIIICTSTPNEFLENIAKKNNLKLFINEQKNGITSDWNFALSKPDAELITLAHQDDIYFPEYAEEMLRASAARRNSIIFFTNYNEIVHAEKKVFIREKTLNFFIKNLILRLFFKFSNYQKENKQRLLLFGSPICCPSVTFQKNMLDNFKFDDNFSINMDWKAWYDLSQKDGGFFWIKKTLLSHRIYSESETSNGLGDNRRQIEDLKMFEKFWPSKIAKLIYKIYSLSYKNNKI